MDKQIEVKECEKIIKAIKNIIQRVKKKIDIITTITGVSK